jgi:hypothetical protein
MQVHLHVVHFLDTNNSPVNISPTHNRWNAQNSWKKIIFWKSSVQVTNPFNSSFTHVVTYHLLSTFYYCSLLCELPESLTSNNGHPVIITFTSFTEICSCPESQKTHSTKDKKCSRLTKPQKLHDTVQNKSVHIINRTIPNCYWRLNSYY